MPLASIGTEFGGRDHSTIVYAVNNVSASIKKDAHLKELVEDIIKNIKDHNNAWLTFFEKKSKQKNFYAVLH